MLSPAAAAGPALAPEWDVVRGVSDSLSERGRAVRVGALLVEFERAWLRGDASSEAPGDAIAALLASQSDGAEVGGLFAGGPVAARLPGARHALAPLVRAVPMGIGGWLQAARVAAAAGDVGFFAGTRSKESLALLLAAPGVTPETQAARDRLDKLLQRRGRPDFGAVAGGVGGGAEGVGELVRREVAQSGARFQCARSHAPRLLGEPEGDRFSVFGRQRTLGLGGLPRPRRGACDGEPQARGEVITASSDGNESALPADSGSRRARPPTRRPAILATSLTSTANVRDVPVRGVDVALDELEPAFCAFGPTDRPVGRHGKALAANSLENGIASDKRDRMP